MRYFDRGRDRHHLRITVGTDAQCDELLAAPGGNIIRAIATQTLLSMTLPDAVAGAERTKHADLAAVKIRPVLVEGDNRPGGTGIGVLSRMVRGFSGCASRPRTRLEISWFMLRLAWQPRTV